MQIKQVWDLTRFRPEKMQKVNLFESPRMFCDIYCLEPGQEQRIHTHRGNDKIYHVLKGRGRFTRGRGDPHPGSGRDHLGADGRAPRRPQPFRGASDLPGLHGAPSPAGPIRAGR